MPEKFLDMTDRSSATRPMGSGRAIKSETMIDGVGVKMGFVASVTAPTSTKVNITRGILTGPNGKQMRVITDPNLSDGDYQKALRSDSFTFDVKAALESLSGAYAALDPATHKVLLTVDVTGEKFRALKITNAEATALIAAIAAGETGNGLVDFDAATADHRARLSVTLPNPETFVSLAVAGEYILGILTLAGIGGAISVVSVRRERKQPWASMAT